MMMAYPYEVIEIPDDSDNEAPPGRNQSQGGAWKQTLFETLNAVQAERKIAAFSTYQLFINPGIRIQGHPIVPLPLTNHYAEVIKEKCKTSQGADVAAPNVWELDHTQFELSNPAWPSTLDEVVGDITKELGASNVLLTLQKLTLQEPGPIVQQKKGSDQSNNTIGTLTICLPSEHQGGNIHLSLGDSILSFNTATSSALDLSAIGWFSDSSCQVKELASGYRLTITYSLYQNTPLRPAAGSNCVRGGRVAELLRAWPLQYSKILYKLDDKQEAGPLSLRELKDRDLAVGQILNDVCPQAGLYMLFAEVIHEVVDDVGEKSINSSTIEGVYTPDGQPLTAKTALDPEKEVLGFDETILGDREFDSDDEDQVCPSQINEEREMIGRYHDIAVLLIRKEELLNLVGLDGHKPSWQERRVPYTDGTYDLGFEAIVDMVVQDLEKFPHDPKAITAVSTVMNNLSGFENDVKGPFIGRIANWSLESGNMLLFETGLRLAPTPVAGVLAEYLAKKFHGKEDDIDWREWTVHISDMPVQHFRYLYNEVWRGILTISEPVARSFHAWAQCTMDQKMESKKYWDYNDRDMIMQVLKERFEEPEWIMNRLLPRIASASVSHPKSYDALLYDILHNIYERRNEPEFANAKEMYQVIIKCSDGRLNFSPEFLEPPGELWAAELPKHDGICGPFVRLITESHLIGAIKEASQVLSGTFTNLVEQKPKWLLVKDAFGLIHCLIAPILRLFAEGRSPPIPAVGEMLELLVRAIIRLDLPRQSSLAGGWAFRERGCGFCDDCAEMNQFLTSPDQTVWKFTARESRRTHILQAIGMNPSLRFITMPDYTGGGCNTLTVTKNEPECQPGLESWTFNYTGLKRILQPLEGDFMKEFLGEQRYRELILLEGVTPFEQPPSVAGVRRPAVEDESEPGKRVRTSLETPGV